MYILRVLLITIFHSYSSFIRPKWTIFQWELSMMMSAQNLIMIPGNLQQELIYSLMGRSSLEEQDKRFQKNGQE